MIQNFKFQISNFKLNKGFTLVELLVSIMVLVAVGSIIGGMIMTSLRGANKTTTIENIRQNGNYALSAIAQSIEYSQTFNGLSNDGINYVASCYSPVVDPTPTPYSIQYTSLKITPYVGDPIIYSCTSSGDLTIASNSASMIDTSSISLTNCSINCIQYKSTDVPIVRISFELGPKNPSGLLETSNPPILFETSLIIRNYKK